MVWTMGEIYPLAKGEGKMHILIAEGWLPLWGVMPENAHTYKGTRIHHEKWWNYPAASDYDRLFIEAGEDIRKHPDWGVRSVTSPGNSVFERRD